MKARILALQKQIAKHNKAYYIDSNPIISDSQYDLIKRELEELTFGNFGLFEGNDSPIFTQGINVKKSSFEKIPHGAPMLSLGNIFTDKDLSDFLKRICMTLLIASFLFAYKGVWPWLTLCPMPLSVVFAGKSYYDCRKRYNRKFRRQCAM